MFINAQDEFTLTDKYMPKQHVFFSKLCVVTMNCMPNVEELDYLYICCTIVFVNTPLFSIPIPDSTQETDVNSQDVVLETIVRESFDNSYHVENNCDRLPEYH